MLQKEKRKIEKVKHDWENNHVESNTWLFRQSWSKFRFWKGIFRWPSIFENYLQPPLNSNRPSSDADSDDENTVAADASDLSGNQLLSSVVLEMKCLSGKMVVG